MLTSLTLLLMMLLVRLLLPYLITSAEQNNIVALTSVLQTFQSITIMLCIAVHTVSDHNPSTGTLAFASPQHSFNAAVIQLLQFLYTAK